ncbi:MAG: OsmC family protein [Rhodocyclaceae bacterium]|nr:OsmC family protein [Rhodocyclaceae bacterium]
MSIIVKRDRTGKMRHQVRIGDHTLIVDEPPQHGGEASGPTPHDLYDAALASCKALTMLWYAQRECIALEDVEVRIERNASQERQGSYCLRAAIAVSGDLSEAQREKLLAVASRSPVHKLMSRATTEIETVWL